MGIPVLSLFLFTFLDTEKREFSIYFTFFRIPIFKDKFQAWEFLSF